MLQGRFGAFLKLLPEHCRDPMCYCIRSLAETGKVAALLSAKTQPDQGAQDYRKS